MRQETSKRAKGGRGFLALAVAVAMSAVAVTRAEPARANNDFQNGFEDQLGRIAAYGAVNFGLHVLTGGYYGPPPVRYYGPPPVRYYGPPPVRYYGPPPVRYYGPSYAYGYDSYPVRHVVKHKYVHKHKHGWNSGHGKGRGHGYDRGRGYDRRDDDGRGHHDD